MRYSVFDPQRFERLSETEVLRRIGELLATALIRSRRLNAHGGKVDAGPKRVNPTLDQIESIRDPLSRKMARYLRITGAASPRELAASLGLARRTVIRKLHGLRADGVCVVHGRTRAARYSIRTDFTAN